jgi:hypothetical protein
MGRSRITYHAFAPPFAPLREIFRGSVLSKINVGWTGSAVFKRFGGQQNVCLRNRLSIFDF